MRRLRPGDEEEAGRIAAVWHSAKGEESEYSAFLSDRQAYILAAYVEGELAGFLIGYELKRLETSRPMMLLYTIDVLPEFRRKGVGTKLVNELKRFCVRRGALKMFVITSESNLPALALYRSTGGKRESSDDVVFVYRQDQMEQVD